MAFTCTPVLHLLCKLILLQLVKQTYANDPDWQPGFGSKEYLITGVKNTFEIGHSLCEAKGGRLVQIESKTENDFAMTLVPTEYDHIWLNAKRSESSLIGLYKHVWLDGSEFTFVSSTYTNNASRPGIAIEKDGAWCSQNYNMFNYIVCERLDKFKRETNEAIEEMRLFISDYSNEAAGQNKKIALMQINQRMEMAAIRRTFDQKMAQLEGTIKEQAVKIEQLINQQHLRERD